MIKKYIEKWYKNKEILKERLRIDTKLLELAPVCDERGPFQVDNNTIAAYARLLGLIIETIINDNKSDMYCNEYYRKREDEWHGIRVVDDGDYSGTLLFIIPRKYYHSLDAEDYLMTYIQYGGCSACDTLIGILQSYENDNVAEFTEEQVSDLLILCKDLLCNMIKPFPGGYVNVNNKV